MISTHGLRGPIVVRPVPAWFTENPRQPGSGASWPDFSFICAGTAGPEFWTGL
jgi:hypothetical protein